MLPILECVLTTLSHQPLGMTHTTDVAMDLAKDDMSLLAAPNNIVEAGSLYSMMEKQLKG